MFMQLLKYIELYLLSRGTIRDLETWLVSNLQQILESGDSNAIEVANKVDADLVEFGEGLIDEATLRDRFDSYIMAANTVPISFGEIEPISGHHATATAETFSDRLVVPGLVENHQVDLVFV